jgi:hypothetical protein
MHLNTDVGLHIPIEGPLFEETEAPTRQDVRHSWILKVNLPML